MEYSYTNRGVYIHEHFLRFRGLGFKVNIKVHIRARASYHYTNIGVCTYTPLLQSLSMTQLAS